MKAEQDGLKRTTRAQVMAWAAECGLGGAGFSLGKEVDGFLQLMHAYGLALWYDEPQLREVVILDPQVRAALLLPGPCCRLLSFSPSRVC